MITRLMTAVVLLAIVGGATQVLVAKAAAPATPAAKPAPKPEAKPVPKPETKPAVAKSAPKAETKPAAKPEPKSTPKPEPKPTNAGAETPAEANAKAAYEVAEKAAREAEAAVGPLRAAMQKADIAYANARKEANAKRQQATDAKNYAGVPGANELKQAEANLPDAIKALTDATKAKPPADKALADAKVVAAPLQQAYDAAEKAAKAAEAAAKVAAEAANKIDDEAKRATAQATAKRRAADLAKAAQARSEQGEQNLLKQIDSATKKLAEAEAAKKAADGAVAGAKNQPQAAQQNLQKQANAAAQKLARALAQKKLAETGLVNVKKQIETAVAAAAAAEKAAQDAAKEAEAKNLAATQAAAKRKAAADAAAALAQAQQREQQAQTQANAATKALADLKAQKTPADAKKLADAETQKKAAEAALANAKQAVAAAAAACQAAQQAGKDLVQLDAANKQAAADFAAKRKAADAARATLTPPAQKLEQAAIQANAAAQNLARTEARKKSTEENLANLKKRIADAKKSFQADDQAAKKAEDVAAPLQTEAEKTRAAYVASMKAADDKRGAAEQAKAALYRLVAARQVASLMENLDPPAPANKIDEIVFAKLKALGIQPVLCSDAVFVRRAYLDLTGKLPTAEEAKAFIQNTDKNKRVALIDRLLEQPAHFDYWAMKWSDILRVKAEFPVKVWPNAAQAYYRWLWESVAQNKPYDQFARDLLTSSGSNFRVGPVNFYRAIQNKTPEGITGVVGLAFMGTRVRSWPEDRRVGMSIFFSQVGYKPTSEWKEEIVFWDPLKSVDVPGDTARGLDAVAKAVTATNQIPQALAKPLSENGPLIGVFPDGTKATIPPNRDPREVFADWLIRPENPWFVKNIVNRSWAWAMGRGIIQDPDDIRDNNPPSNPELLAYLEKELVSSRYDLKRLKRLIFTSSTYQFSSIPRSKAPEAKANFASYLLRRVEAEVLIDALNEITGSSDLYTSAVPEPFTYIPHDMSAVELADGSVTSSFLTLFGRSSRSTGMEAERVSELASTQWLHMLNSAAVQNKLLGGPKLNALLAAGGKTNEIAERLYLTILSRFPTDADMKTVEQYAKTGPTKGRDMWIDLAWALVNSPEFLLRH